ncbi:MAG: hypothetical protein ACI9MU_002491, partial [Alphaproteobacteria bacterium]
MKNSAGKWQQDLPDLFLQGPDGSRRRLSGSMRRQDEDLGS